MKRVLLLVAIGARAKSRGKSTSEQTIEAYRLGSACAELQENEKGSVAPGKLADLVISSDDIFAFPPEKLPDVRVEPTAGGGRVVYSSEKRKA